MKLYLILLGLLLNSFLLNAQTTKYFKDINCLKEVQLKKAKFKKVELLRGDTLVTQKIKIKGNVLLSEKKTLKNKPVGTWSEYGFDGKLLSSKTFDNLVYSDEEIPDMYDNKTSDSIYTKAEFPNGMSGMMRFLGENINYPQEARENNISGTIFLRFLIKKDGTVTPLSIIKGVDPSLDAEAWRVVKKFPKWNPALKNSIPIDSYYELPVRFMLAN